MVLRSAGILVYRRRAGDLEYLLGHHGGPFWARRHEGAWTIPKGQIEPGEDAQMAARREFLEETGLLLEAPLEPLGQVRTPKKVIEAYLAEANLELTTFTSNSFSLEWPKGSGRVQTWPELDRLAYWSTADAERLIVQGQRPLIARAQARLA